MEGDQVKCVWCNWEEMGGDFCGVRFWDIHEMDGGQLVCKRNEKITGAEKLERIYKRLGAKELST
jgi:hypothetical protein